MVNFTQKVKKMYKHTDYYKTYGRIMQFNKTRKSLFIDGIRLLRDIPENLSNLL